MQAIKKHIFKKKGKKKPDSMFHLRAFSLSSRMFDMGPSLPQSPGWQPSQALHSAQHNTACSLPTFGYV